MKLIFVLTLTLGMVASARGQSKVVNQKKIYDIIVKAGIQHPKIVLRQAVVESGHFKSKGARNKNNILGLMRGDGRALLYFKSVTECLLFYRDNVQNRYKGGDYYRFLKRIGYAKDKYYIRKVKGVELYIE